MGLNAQLNLQPLGKSSKPISILKTESYQEVKYYEF